MHIYVHLYIFCFCFSLINKNNISLVIIYFKFRYPFSADQEIVEPDWEVFLRATANFIVQEQSPKK